MAVRNSICFLLAMSLSSLVYSYGPRLTAFLPNYAVYNKYDDDIDQPALKAGLSIKYVLGNCVANSKSNIKSDEKEESDADSVRKLCFLSNYADKYVNNMFVNTTWNKAKITGEFSFIYTTEFDFYVDGFNDSDISSRLSSPVIGRYQNPGLYYELRANPSELVAKDGEEYGFFWHLRSIGLGVWHESNGQQLDNERWASISQDERDDYISLLQEEGADEEHWKDTISRSFTIFPEITHSYWFNLDRNTNELCIENIWCWQLFLSHRFGYGWKNNVEDTVLTETGVDYQYSLADYDRHRVTLTNEWKVRNGAFLRNPGWWFKDNVLRKEVNIDKATVGICAMSVSGKLTTGDFKSKHNSYDFGLRMDINVFNSMLIPLYLRWHRGPHENFSEYHENIDTFGIGLQFRTRDTNNLPESCIS